jgi:hypothetical protein
MHKEADRPNLHSSINSGDQSETPSTLAHLHIRIYKLELEIKHPDKQATAPEDGKASADVPARWTKSRKAWVFAVGLATVVGGIAAVLALFVH